MPKKKGNLKNALQSHLVVEQQRARQRAAEEAAKKKALSITRSRQGLAHKANKSKSASQSIPPTSSQSIDKKPLSSESDGANRNCGPDSDAAVSHDAERRQSKRRKRLPQPFTKDDSILIVGEANFSFTLSLLLPPRSHPPSQILATAYDTQEECFAKYPDAQANVEKIRSIAGGRKDIVVFGVDAGQLHKYKQVTGGGSNSGSKSNKSKDKIFGGFSDFQSEGRDTDQGRRWSKVWFGFPHVGAGHKDETRNVLANQLLILRFLVSVAPYLTVGSLPSYVPGSQGGGGKRQRGDESDLDDEEHEVGSNDEEDLGLAQDTSDGLDQADQAILDATNAQVGMIQPLRPPNKQGSVLITLRNASPYTLWDVANLAKRLPQLLPVISASAPALPKGIKKPTLQDVIQSGLSVHSPSNLHSSRKADSGGDSPSVRTERKRSAFRGGNDQSRSYHLWRSFEFDPTEWKGYSHRRTIGWIEGVSTTDNEDLLRAKSSHSNNSQDHAVRASKAGRGECRTWEFGLQ